MQNRSTTKQRAPVSVQANCKQGTSEGWRSETKEQKAMVTCSMYDTLDPNGRMIQDCTGYRIGHMHKGDMLATHPAMHARPPSQPYACQASLPTICMPSHPPSHMHAKPPSEPYACQATKRTSPLAKQHFHTPQHILHLQQRLIVSVQWQQSPNPRKQTTGVHGFLSNSRLAAVYIRFALL
eukprot:1144446-Pelagomonas_calceolata.AAC.2